MSLFSSLTKSHATKIVRMWSPSIQSHGRASAMAFSTSAENKLDFDNTIIITKNCAKRIKQLQAKSSNDQLYMRLAVEGGGCSGFKYTFKMEDLPINEEEDSVFEKDGSKVIVDKGSFELVKGATVDYVEEMMRSAFTVSSNPQSETACGCGSSFAVKNFAANPALD